MYSWKKLSVQQKCSWNTVRQGPFSKLLYCANYYVLPCVEKSLQSTDMLDCFQGLQMLRHKDMYVSYTKHLCLHVLQIFSCACCLHLTNAAWYGGDVMQSCYSGWLREQWQQESLAHVQNRHNCSFSAQFWLTAEWIHGWGTPQT